MPPADLERARAEVMEVVTLFYDDLSTGKWSQLSSRFAPGGTVTTVTRGLRFPTRISTESAEQYALTVVKTDRFTGLSEVEAGVRVTLVGELAQVWAQRRARRAAAGGNVPPSEAVVSAESAGYDAFTLVKQGDQWRIVSVVQLN